INAGVPNKVVALRNGTMGWQLAGLTCVQGRSVRYPDTSADALAWAQSAARQVEKRFGIGCIDRETLTRWHADKTRTTYVFDVRDPTEYAAGHLPGAISAPGGQLVQATDAYIGTLGARIVLSDDKEVRAVMTASWLKQMGWRDVFVLPQTGEETDAPNSVVLGTPSRDVIDVARLRAMTEVTVIDLSPSPVYKAGHIPGAWFAIRSRLPQALKTIAPSGSLVLTSEDGVVASLAVNEVRALIDSPVSWLAGGNAAWRSAGLPLSTEPRMADEPLDVWLKPYEQSGDRAAAMNAYLAWEVDLLERIKRDGTTNFSTTPR